MSMAAITNAYTLYCDSNGMRRLSKSFQPGKYDVLCARGKNAQRSEGNRRFRALVKLYQERYSACTGKVEKSKIVAYIVKTVRYATPNGGFIKIINGEYWDAGDRAAKEKVGQTFRDLLHTKYSSSTKAKARARMEKKVHDGQPQTFTPLKVKVNMQGFPASLFLSPKDMASIDSASDESSFNHTEDSSYGPNSPSKQKSPYIKRQDSDRVKPVNLVETMRNSIRTIDARRGVDGGAHSSQTNLQVEPINLVGTLRSSIHTIHAHHCDDSDVGAHCSDRNCSDRRSLLRCSIYTIDEARDAWRRSSFRSIVADDDAQDPSDSLSPLPFLEITTQQSGFSNEFNTHDDLEDNFDEDLQDFLGAP